MPNPEFLQSTEQKDKNDGVDRNMGENDKEKNVVEDGERALDNMNEVVGDSDLQEVVSDSFDVVESINKGNKLVVVVESVSKSLWEQSKYDGGIEKSLHSNSAPRLGHNMSQKIMEAQVMSPNIIELTNIAPSSSRGNDFNWSIVPYHRNVITKKKGRKSRRKLLRGRGSRKQ